MTDRTTPPAIVDAVHYNLHLKPCQEYTLRNGVKVYAVDAGAEEVLQLEWVFYAGNSFEEQNLVAATTNFMLRNGTVSKTAFQVNEFFEYHGAYLNRACYNETATVTLHCLNKHIGTLLPEVRELLTQSTMPSEELVIYKQNMQQRLKVNLKKSDFVAGRLIDVYLYGEHHPYGKYSREEDFKLLERDQLLHFYNQFYTQGQLIMFVAGKLPADLFALLDQYFGDLPNKTVQVPEHPVVPAAEKKYRISNDPTGAQGSVRIARPFPNRHHPDFLKVQVLNAVFGGYFGSRLMSNIREDKGYTYGIHSYLQNHLGPSAWMISTEAGKDVSEATVAEIFKEMQLLRDEPVDDEELLLVRNYLIGSILGDLDGPFQIIGRWKNIILNNLKSDYFYNSIQTIKTISAEELQALARQYLREEDFYELIVV